MKAQRCELQDGRKAGRVGQAKAGRGLNVQVMAWSMGPVPGPDHVLGQGKWLWVPNPREGSGLMERLLEIFIDEVKFIVFLKPIPFLLGGRTLAGDRAASLSFEAVIDLCLSGL